MPSIDSALADLRCLDMYSIVDRLEVTQIIGPVVDVRCTSSRLLPVQVAQSMLAG